MRIGEIYDLEDLQASEPAETDAFNTRSDLGPGASCLLRAQQSASRALGGPTTATGTCAPSRLPAEQGASTWWLHSTQCLWRDGNASRSLTQDTSDLLPASLLILQSVCVRRFCHHQVSPSLRLHT
jgi:hypothetical protein